MKIFFFKILFSCFVFILCLALCETFFIFNKKNHWFSPKPAENKSEVFWKVKYRDIPEDVLARAKKMYPETVDLAKVEKLNERASFLKRNYKTISTAQYFAEIGQHPAPFFIQESSVDEVTQDVIFNAQYEFTDDFTRKVPNQQKILTAAKNILLVGCSFTFGVGVNDNQTVAYFMKKNFPKYNIYNFGFPGEGLPEVLDDVTNQKRLKSLNRKGGAVIYTFIYDHFERTFCSFDCYREERNWGLDKNKYAFDSDGKLINYGPYKDVSPLKTEVLTFFARSEFLRFIGYQHPKWYDAEEQKLYVRYLKYLRDFYAQYNLDFYVFSRDGYALYSEFFEEMDKNKIKYMFYNYNDSRNMTLELVHKLKIPGDGHNTEMGNYLFAELISEDLKKDGY